jgi:SHS2 domain-containing protein
MEETEICQSSGFEEVEHTADWAYRVWGPTLSDLFIQAARGLYSLAGAQIAPEPCVDRTLELQGVDTESLLIAWLNELLNLHESKNLACDRFEIVKLEEQTLQAKVTGAPVQQWVKDIKAATYHNLAIHPTPTGFEVTIVLDV